ncbi:HAD-IIB family hydrolase [Halomonas denitrificans]|uniref:HAD-IIB family hydrolase n=1 Tax=Halomonas TaxID=2745 RepID=UPI001C94D64A|nr:MULTISPECIES: HAD-IIB family hydrolase [Halomonas]MBY5968441.1 HAD-IIB family hydrolase [Halomonas denitrificans]MBY5984182.1 HAD-IIB family hydrolase [Halomonas sp. DP5Y7-2]MBY6207754.1 HAD-IIB family hydrolase [Halomonas sp. DP3Y7-2]MBY6228563.1 HAD-IIB family hydrolase [Halomonas sp. DP3Y7-1]MCA0916629.1 HAD-IIB family hydrolase [Halomonas denitrificans]
MHATATPCLGDSAEPRLLFTDLDGSLLDHHDYDWAPAQPWLETLRKAGVGVIPVTSKTRSELLGLRQALGLADQPFIAENGAVIALPESWCHARREGPVGPDGLVIRTLGVDIGLIRRRVAIWRERLSARFLTMSEMALEDVVAFTGLDEQEARLARLREGSEPLLWEDDDALLQRFREGLAGDGLRMTRGGRFWHVLGDTDKGQAVRWLCARYEALKGKRPTTLSLGDGPNDVAMLEATDAAVVIRGQHGLDVRPDQPNLYRSEAMGPRGWAEGVAHCWGANPQALEAAARGDQGVQTDDQHHHLGGKEDDA